MNFLEKLDYLMEKKHLNKSKLSKLSGVPYTTIDGFYKKGYENTKISTIQKLAAALNVSLDYLADDSITDEQPRTDGKILRVDFGAKKAPSQRDEADEIADVFRQLDEHGKGAVRAILNFEHASAVAEQRQAGAKKPKAKTKKRSDGMQDVEVFDQPSAAGLGNYLSDIASHVEQYPANVIPEGTEFGVRISGNSMSPNIPDKATAFVQSKIAIEPGQVGIFLLNGESFCKKLEVDREKQEIRLVSFNPDYKDRIVEECDDFRTLGLVLGHWPK